MKIGKWAWMLLAAAPLLSGCAGFWDTPPSSGSFTLSNSSNIAVTPGATTGNTSTITVTPASSFTGTVALACSVTSAPTSAVSPATCSLSPTSLAFSTATAQTSTLYVATTSTTTAGSYQISVTGTSSGSASATTNLCAQVSSNGATCTASGGANSGIFYIVNSNSITGYSISGGTLTALSGSSFTLTVATISSVAIGPQGSNFLYLGTNGGIVPFTINTSTGALTQGSTFGDNLAEAIAVDPSGKWLLEASVAGVLYAYPITSTGAEDTTRSVQTTATLASNLVQPGGIAISPNGALVAVALGGAGTQTFPFNASPTSGGPLQAGFTPIAPTNLLGAAVAVAFDPQIRLMYVGETDAFPNNSSTNNSGGLRSFAVSGSSLSELTSGSPTASGGTTPRAILPISTGNDVYVANWVGSSTGNVTGFTVASSNSTYTLTALSPTVATGTEPYGLAEDSTLGYVLAVSNSGTTFDAYTLSSGQLTSSLTGSPVTSPIAIVAVP